MGEKLTFENYLPGDARELDPKWQEKYGYRAQTYMPHSMLGKTRSEIMQINELNAGQQEKRSKYADGLHGYEYYNMAGQDKSEYEALKKRFDASIPANRWVISESVTLKTADQDRREFFERLEAIQPPAFINKDVTADAKKGMSRHWKKTIKKQLDDYKEMRANWEKTDMGREWKAKVQRLKDMESGTLVPDETQGMQISAPSGMKKYARNVEHIEGVTMDTSKAGHVGADTDLHSYVDGQDLIQKSIIPRAGMDAEMTRLNAKYNGDGYRRDENGQIFYGGNLRNSDGSLVLKGTIGSRLMYSMVRSLGQGMDGKAIEKLFDKLMAPHRADLDMSDEAAVIMADREFLSGVRDLKKIIYSHLKRIEATYGTLPTQMKADDFMRMAPKEVFDHFTFLQDAEILLSDAAALFDLAANDEDKEFKRLYEYYEHSWQSIKLFLQADYIAAGATAQNHAPQYAAMTTVTVAMQEEKKAKSLAAGVGGPHLEGKEKEDYEKTVAKRAASHDAQNMFLYSE